MDEPAEIQVVTTPIQHWVYALPGAHLEGLRSAGAPSLQELATGPDDHHHGLAGDDPLAWRAWVLYGSPDHALQDLCGQDDDHAIAAWREQLLLAAKVKRRWRDRLVLINLDTHTVDGHQPSPLDVLHQHLPELEVQERLNRRSQAAHGSNQLATLAALALLQSDPALLQSYLDLENWADFPASMELRSRWRTSPSHQLLLGAMRSVARLESAASQNNVEIDSLVADGLRVQRECEWLQHNVEQLEAELEHYVAEHLSLSSITRRLEEQLLRARRLIQSFSRPAVGGPPSLELR